MGNNLSSAHTRHLATPGGYHVLQQVANSIGKTPCSSNAFGKILVSR